MVIHLLYIHTSDRAAVQPIPNPSAGFPDDINAQPTINTVQGTHYTSLLFNGKQICDIGRKGRKEGILLEEEKGDSC